MVPCPLPPYAPLAVVQPQEGLKLAADSETRYECVSDASVFLNVLQRHPLVWKLHIAGDLDTR